MPSDVPAPSDRVRAEPVVSTAPSGGVFHEVFTGTVEAHSPEGEGAMPDEDVVMVDPDGEDAPRPVRRSNVTVLEADE